MLPLILFALAAGLFIVPDLRAEAATGTPAHSLAAAMKASAMPKNSWQYAPITSKNSQNWYRLTVSSRSYLYALLGDLPANYNLRLYDAEGKQLAGSNKSGTKPESISRMLAPGHYFLRVASSSGFSRTKKYALLARVAPSSAEVAVLTSQFGNYGNSIVGEIANVSSTWLSMDYATVSYYDANGKRLRRLTHQFRNPLTVLAPGAREPFRIITDTIPTAVKQKVKRFTITDLHVVRSAAPAATDLALSGLKKRAGTEDGLRTYTWSGTVRNRGTRKVKGIDVVVMTRNKRGVVTGMDDQPFITLAAKKSKKFSVLYYNWLPGQTFTVKPYVENVF